MDRNAAGRGAGTFFCRVVLRRSPVRLRLLLLVVSDKGSVVFNCVCNSTTACVVRYAV